MNPLFLLRSGAQTTLEHSLTAQPGLRLKGPFPPYKFAVPLQQRVRLEEEHDVTEPGTSTSCHRREFAGKDEQCQFLPAGNAGRVSVLPLENTELLLQEQDLDILVMLGSTVQADEVEEQRERLRENKVDHGVGVAGTIPRSTERPTR